MIAAYLLGYYYPMAVIAPLEKKQPLSDALQIELVVALQGTKKIIIAFVFCCFCNQIVAQARRLPIHRKVQKMAKHLGDSLKSRVIAYHLWKGNKNHIIDTPLINNVVNVQKVAIANAVVGHVKVKKLWSWTSTQEGGLMEIVVEIFKEVVRHGAKKEIKFPKLYLDIWRGWRRKELIMS